MAPRSLALALVTILALTASARSHPPGCNSPETCGPQFLFGWTAAERETALKALDTIKDKPGIAEPRWINARAKLLHWGVHRGYRELAERNERIQTRLSQGFAFYDQDWKLIRPFILHGPSKTTCVSMADSYDVCNTSRVSWSIIQMPLSFVTLTGLAVSRDRYCGQPWSQCDMSIEDGLAADERAIALFERSFRNLEYMTPGGARH